MLENSPADATQLPTGCQPEKPSETSSSRCRPEYRRPVRGGVAARGAGTAAGDAGSGISERALAGAAKPSGSGGGKFLQGGAQPSLVVSFFLLFALIRFRNLAKWRTVRWCRSFFDQLTVTAPIEQVVDPHLHHLNVAVALGESVAEWGPSRNSKCPIVQPKVIIFDLC